MVGRDGRAFILHYRNRLSREVGATGCSRDRETDVEL